jgi:hypothetical protein
VRVPKTVAGRGRTLENACAVPRPYAAWAIGRVPVGEYGREPAAMVGGVAAPPVGVGDAPTAPPSKASHRRAHSQQKWSKAHSPRVYINVRPSVLA